MERLAETLLRKVRQILKRVGRDALHLGIRTAKNDRRKLDLFIRLEPGRPALAPAVAQAVDPAASAAAFRSMPESALAIARSRRDTRASLSDRARRRSTAAVLSLRIVSATIKSLRPNQQKHCTTGRACWESSKSQTSGSTV
jgi:hypothetical protein